MSLSFRGLCDGWATQQADHVQRGADALGSAVVETIATALAETPPHPDR
jgi:hypothetical protein